MSVEQKASEAASDLLVTTIRRSPALGTPEPWGAVALPGHVRSRLRCAR